MESKGAVLLVDRNATSKGSPTTRLKEFGYDVTSSSGGDDAVERLRKKTFDVVVSAVSVQQSGDAFVRRLRELQIDLPIILLSGKLHRRARAREERMLFRLERRPEPGLLEQTVARAVALCRQVHLVRQAVATSRNVSTQQVEVQEFTATDARNEFAHMLDMTARRGVVVIEKQNAPKAVLLSFEDFNALTARPTRTLDTLSADFDKLLGRMQAAGARTAMKRAFDATPEELGAAARSGAAARTPHA